MNREPSKKVGAVSRADLVDLLNATNSPDFVVDFAAIGFEPKAESRIIDRPKDVKPSEKSEIKTQAPFEWTQFDPAPSQYWRVAQYVTKELPENTEVQDVEISIRQPDEILREAAFSPINGLEFQPLAEPRYLLTQLRRVSGTRRSRNQLDMVGAVNRLSRGEFLHRIPLRARRVWGHDLMILEDRSRRLVPYWSDQDFVTAQLKKIYPVWGFSLARLNDGCRFPEVLEPRERRHFRFEPPPPDTLVLAMTDLGCLVSGKSRETTQVSIGDNVQKNWLRIGRDLRDNGNRAIAVVPCHPSQIPHDLAQLWTIVPWERIDPNNDAPDTSIALQRLLRFLAPVVRLEPELLRAVRRFCPDTRGDAGMEARVWQHELIVSRHSDAASLNESIRKELLEQFELEPPEIRADVLELIEAARQWSHPSVWFEEVLSLDSGSQQLLPNPRHVDLAIEFFGGLATDNKKPFSAEMKAWIKRWSVRLRRTRGLPDSLSRKLSQLLSEIDGREERPLEEWEPDSPAPTKGEERKYRIGQIGSGLRFNGFDEHDESRAPDSGSFLADIRTIGSEIYLFDHVRDIGAVVNTPSEETAESFWLNGGPPSWASDWGRDGFGSWASFQVEGIFQRMRWISAGEFKMGSPDTEDGRWDNEGPQHQVEISRGFWMFDTPCTQALWQAVMGSSSKTKRFVPPMRPVTEISWDDAQEFLKKLNSRLPGMNLRLPTEAEWEYSCRADSGSAPRYGELDAIAWYSENSGDEIHDVKLKAPNNWGLYDMIGNVYEWCHDSQRKYSKQSQIDPGPEVSGAAVRVVRGGCWVFSSLYARAAYRNAFRSSDRYVNLGFRCLSSVEPSSSQPIIEQASAAAKNIDVSEPRRSRSDRQYSLTPHTQGQPNRPRLVKLNGTESVTIGLPQVGVESTTNSLLIETDRESVRIELGPAPDWAVASGRDRFGLWGEFEFKSIRQRMRWIPPGTFRMGSPNDEEGRMDDEGPQHDVTLSKGFWLFDSPCTQDLWKAVMNTDPSKFKGDRRPVEQVNWTEAKEFMGTLNAEIPNLNLRLPSEAEWEYSCRAGTTSARYGELDAIAWYDKNSEGQTHEVGKKLPNSWGLYDMLGNVWEWCEDSAYRKYDEKAQTDPRYFEKDSAIRVIRGGSWGSSSQDARAAYRGAYHSSNRYDYLGFRCLSSVEPSPSNSAVAEMSGSVSEPGRSRPDRKRESPRSGKNSTKKSKRSTKKK